MLVTALFSASLLWAQASGISGRVLDEQGAPIIGATVMVKGTTIATATNVDGSFELKNASRNVTLVVSYVGYETQQVSSQGKASVTITLKPEAIGVESVEIVSVGYGTQKRESIVGAISTIRPEELRVPDYIITWRASSHCKPLASRARTMPSFGFVVSLLLRAVPIR